MMHWFQAPLRPRAAQPADSEALVTLLHRAPHAHLHLDWNPPEAWLGTQPFWLAERRAELLGALACPPAPPDTAWIRLVASSTTISPAAVWELLWPPSRAALQAQHVTSVAALSMEHWLEPLLRAAGFQQTHAVVVLHRAGHVPLNAHYPLPASVQIRSARAADYPALIATDTAAFQSPWQLSATLLEAALTQADYVTLAETLGEVIGYQLTTASLAGAHLGRLAVLPSWQGRGLGRALAADMVAHYHQHSMAHLSVNTQNTNAASLRVYQQLGFRLSGEEFPVYQLTLPA